MTQELAAFKKFIGEKLIFFNEILAILNLGLISKF
jgi:hypothetical protein